MQVRTTTLGINNTMVNYIMNQSSDYNKLSEEAASGKKLTEPSDDASAARQVLSINTQLSQLNGYLGNMSTASEELKTLDSSLSSLDDLVQNASDLATQAANGTYSSTDLADIKTQVDSIIDSVVSLSNTKFNGNYIFSGTDTSTPAYTVTKDTSGHITGITYNGTSSSGDYERKVNISDGVNVTINTTGDEVFGEYAEDSSGNVTKATGILGTLMTLSNALGKSDQTAVSGTLNSLTTEMSDTLAVQAKFASVSNKFDLTETSINTTVTNLTEYKSNLEDADLSEVLAELAESKVALQATYSVTSQMLQGMSILNYL